VAAPALAPPEVTVDPALMAQYSKELSDVRQSIQAFVSLELTVMVGCGATPSRGGRRPLDYLPGFSALLISSIRIDFLQTLE
jgi:hypothetical protein